MATQYPFQCKLCGFELWTNHEGVDVVDGGSSYLYTCDQCGSFIEKTTDPEGKKILFWTDVLSNKSLYNGFFGEHFDVESEDGTNFLITKYRLANDEECPVCKNMGYLKRWNPVKCKCPKCKKGEMIQLPGIMETD